MSYSRYQDQITLTMTSVEYAYLLWILGFAAGAMSKEGDRGFYRLVAFVNDLNVGNPNFTPYEIPDRYREETQ